MRTPLARLQASGRRPTPHRATLQAHLRRRFHQVAAMTAIGIIAMALGLFGTLHAWAFGLALFILGGALCVGAVLVACLIRCPQCRSYLGRAALEIAFASLGTQRACPYCALRFDALVGKA